MTEPTAAPISIGASEAVPEPVRSALFGPGRRATTVGLVLLTLVTAFEAMGVGTAMPAVIADLGAVSAYGWPFSRVPRRVRAGDGAGRALVRRRGAPARAARHAAAVRGRADRRRHRGHAGPAAGRAGAAGGERGDPVRRGLRDDRGDLPGAVPARGVRAHVGGLGAAVADRPAGGGAGHRAVLVALGVPRARPVRRGRVRPGRPRRAPAAPLRPACGDRTRPRRRRCRRGARRHRRELGGPAPRSAGRGGRRLRAGRAGARAAPAAARGRFPGRAAASRPSSPRAD